MTSLISPEEKIERGLAQFKNALSKLAPHQIEQILLIFNMAAKYRFGVENQSAQIIERLGREKAAKLTLKEFLAKVEAEMPAKEEIIKPFRDLAITFVKNSKTRKFD